MANKLELTWYGKDEPIVVEPRILIEDTARSKETLINNTMLSHKQRF